MKKEEPRFVPGDKVICCDSKMTAPESSAYGLIEGKSYIIQSAIRCSCGLVYVSVGIKDRYQISECGRCGKEYQSNGTSLHRQTRFAFPEEVQQAEDAIRQLQNENLKV